MGSEVDLRQLAIDRRGTDKPKVHLRRHVVTRYVLPGTLVVGFLGLVAWTSRDAVFPPKPVTVIPVFATQADVQQAGTVLFSAAGWIEPRPTPVRAAALAPGVVEKLLVVEDQPVTAGQPVAELIKDDAQLAYGQARADLHLREAELEESLAALKAAETRLSQPVHLEASLGEAEASLAKMQTQLKNLPFATRRAEADLKAAQKDYEGKAESKGVVSRVDIEIARSKVESAVALVEELRDRKDSLQKEIEALVARRDALQVQLDLLADETKARDQAKARVKAAKARVEQAEVALAKQQLQLDRMTVRSPIDGRVFRLIGHPGARIGSGMTQMTGHDGSTIVTLYRPSMLQARVDVRFEDIPKVVLNQQVRIDNPALSTPLTGKVLFISSEADIQKNTLQVKVDIPDPPDLFKPEMLVDVAFLAPESASDSKPPTQDMRLFIPRRVIQQGSDGSFVWVADQSSGVARQVPITIGATRGAGLVEIKGGLMASSRIIVTGSDGLEDGTRVRVTGEQSPFEPGLPQANSTPAEANGGE